ncbi:carbohydrate ABC transporter permease [Pedococcus sp. 5OH_020]|uniref:carbohydrate ABC transporter permease n=1 Tax=Pedococcus sp. 5OH_020 TaxID=2989814 RepID=UPI0022E9E8C7|nr:carbohydrate ABC transporter permease [Pedococcus sp. 5OH_020]
MATPVATSPSTAVGPRDSAVAAASGRRPGVARNRLLALIAWCIVVGALSPFAWLISTAFKSRLDAFSPTPVFLTRPTLENFRSVLSQGEFALTYANSLIVVLATTAFTLLFGISAGYALARSDRASSRWMGRWIIVVRMTPPMAFALPMFLMFQRLHLLDTYPALVLVYLTITLPFCTWLMAGYFMGIPPELEEAARIDGCSRVSALWRVILPSARPGIATAAIFSFISSWNEFFYPLVVAGRTTKPASVAIQGFISSAGVDWGGLSAAALLVLAPVFVFSLFTQRGLVSGLTAGAVK